MKQIIDVFDSIPADGVPSSVVPVLHQIVGEFIGVAVL